MRTFWWEAFCQREMIQRILESEFRLKSWIRLNDAKVIYQDNGSIFYSRRGHAREADQVY
jgi:hypothetical protein